MSGIRWSKREMMKIVGEIKQNVERCGVWESLSSIVIWLPLEVQGVAEEGGGLGEGRGGSR